MTRQSTAHQPGGAAAWVHEVPTHLGVEDRALFGLTVHQLLYLASGATCAYGLWHEWTFLPVVVRLALAVACACLALALVFVRPGGRGLGAWALPGLRYIAAPRASVWRSAADGVVGASYVPGWDGSRQGWSRRSTRPEELVASWVELPLQPGWTATSLEAADEHGSPFHLHTRREGVPLPISGGERRETAGPTGWIGHVPVESDSWRS